jgi:hypothetical protein
LTAGAAASWGPPLRPFTRVVLEESCYPYKLTVVFRDSSCVSRFWRIGTARRAYDTAVWNVEQLMSLIEEEVTRA